MLGFMAKSASAAAVKAFIESLPDERRVVISAVRDVICAHLPKGYEEQMLGNAIGYVVPHKLYPPGYHCNPKHPLSYAWLDNQKSHAALHLMGVYGDEATAAWFTKAWKATGKKLDMGKACVRFKKLEDVPLEVVGQVIARIPVDAYIARIEKVVGARRK
jgi:hypothetical protein